MSSSKAHTLTNNQFRVICAVWDNGTEMRTEEVLRMCSSSELQTLQRKGYLRAMDGYQRLTDEGKKAVA